MCNGSVVLSIGGVQFCHTAHVTQVLALFTAC